MRRFIKAGGILKAGSDPNHGMPALGLHQEMTMMVEAGLSPMQAIQAGTINVARGYHKDKDLGP
jgi:imidazolonepropionase-like amidohydrolase